MVSHFENVYFRGLGNVLVIVIGFSTKNSLLYFILHPLNK